MKKNVFLMMFLAISTLANAAMTSGANFQLYANISGATDNLLLLEDDSYALSDADQSATKVLNTANPTSVNIYVADATLGNLAQLGTSSLTNTPITIVTNETETSYKIKLLGMAPGSRALKLYDLQGGASGTETVITEFTGTTVEYSFTAAANSTIEGRFFIDYDPTAFVTSLTTNAYGWATFSYDSNLKPVLPAGLKIYTGAVNGEYLDLTQVDYVKANEGVVVYGTPSTTYYFAAGTGASVYGTNHLHPTSVFDPANYSNVYVLKGEELLEYTGTVALAANKAYLQLPANNPAPASRRISFRFEETTGVENTVAPAKVEKFVEDGQVLIKRGEAVYNLQGQMVR